MPTADKTIRFELEKGTERPVCEACLKLLNHTAFERAPFCGRPDGGAPPGFTQLERHYLSAQEILPLFTLVYELMRHNDQHHVDRFFDSATNSWSPDPETAVAIQTLLDRNWIHVWTYVRPIDIENSDSPVNLLIWQGYGAADVATICGAGEDDYHPWDFNYVKQRAFVLSGDSRSIDEVKTREIFGRASGPTSSPVVHEVRRGDAGFATLSDSIGVSVSKVGTTSKPKINRLTKMHSYRPSESCCVNMVRRRKYAPWRPSAYGIRDDEKACPLNRKPSISKKGIYREHT